MTPYCVVEVLPDTNFTDRTSLSEIICELLSPERQVGITVIVYYGEIANR